jgi:hypothetical protein
MPTIPPPHSGSPSSPDERPVVLRRVVEHGIEPCLDARHGEGLFNVDTESASSVWPCGLRAVGRQTEQAREPARPPNCRRAGCDFG